MTSPVEKIPAVILAGGRSSRMGGGDKSLLDLAGRTVIAHVIERLSLQAGPLAINANGDPARFNSFNLPVIVDTHPGFAGPLAGILTALHWAAGRGASHVVTIAGDTPFIPTDLVARLLKRADEANEQIVLAASAGRTHPVIGLWSINLRDRFRDHFASDGSRKVTDFAALVGFTTVEFAPVQGSSGPELDPFFNINTPDDLALAQTYAEHQTP